MNLNKYILSFLFIVINLPVFAQPKWQPQFNTALQLARSQQKLILLNFSGSDWCLPCMVMKKNYFNDANFLKMADSDLLMVNADFPIKKKNKVPKDIKLQNDMLAEKYNRAGNFPFTVLLNFNGEVLKSWNGKPTSLDPKELVFWQRQRPRTSFAQASVKV